jgi:tRNA nucleotidyltransferase (CCA-adding enzyme)
MRLILTHEQSDFDALASLLGAYLLDEAAIPGSSSQDEPQCACFYNTLWGRTAICGGTRFTCGIDRISLSGRCTIDGNVEGMTPETTVHVIDHHPLRDDLPSNWTVITEDIGATSTLLVEQLQEQNGLLSVIHATLLLLGFMKILAH